MTMTATQTRTMREAILRRFENRKRNAAERDTLLNAIDQQVATRSEFLQVDAKPTVRAFLSDNPTFLREAIEAQTIKYVGENSEQTPMDMIFRALNTMRPRRIVREAIEQGVGEMDYLRALADLDDKELATYHVASRLNILGILPGDDYQIFLNSLIWNGGNAIPQSRIKGRDAAVIAGEVTQVILDQEWASGAAAVSFAMREFEGLQALLADDPEVSAVLRRELGVQAEWASSQESNGLLADAPGQDRLLLGEADGQKVFLNDPEACLFTVGSRGSGKTQCHMLPNLRLHQGSAIILDVKGECFAETADFREDRYGKVFVFAPGDDSSNSYNPLQFIDKDADDFWDECARLAGLMVIVSDGKDRSWDISARDLLTVFIAFTVLTEPAPSMARVVSLCDGRDNAVMFETIEAHTEWPSRLRDKAHGFAVSFKQQGTQWSGYTGVLGSHISVWSRPSVERVTQASDWTPLAFRKPGTSLYLCVSTEDIQDLAPVLRVILGQHVRKLMARGQEHERGDPSILFFLDEFPQLGEMPPVEEALSVGRSYGLRLWLICQNLGQVYAAYGEHRARTLLGGCDVELYLKPTEKDARELSERLGEKKHAFDPYPRPVMTPQELTQGDFARQKILGFMPGLKPLMLDKLPNHVLKARAGP